jgi:hypothetical protein
VDRVHQRRAPRVSQRGRAVHRGPGPRGGPRAVPLKWQRGLAGSPARRARRRRQMAGRPPAMAARRGAGHGRQRGKGEEEGGLTVRQAVRGDGRGGELLGTTAGRRSRGGSMGGTRRTRAAATSSEGDGVPTAINEEGGVAVVRLDTAKTEGLSALPDVAPSTGGKRLEAPNTASASSARRRWSFGDDWRRRGGREAARHGEASGTNGGVRRWRATGGGRSGGGSGWRREWCSGGGEGEIRGGRACPCGGEAGGGGGSARRRLEQR